MYYLERYKSTVVISSLISFFFLSFFIYFFNFLFNFFFSISYQKLHISPTSIGKIKMELKQCCMVIDFDGFYINKNFFPRELGCASLTKKDKYYSYRFDLRSITPNENEIKHINYCTQNIHGLPFYPSKTETTYSLESLEEIIKNMYYENKTNEQYIIGYKGGNIENKILNNLKLPNVNLERFGCPKYDDLPKPNVNDCGYHINLNRKRKIHCPKQECFAFTHWLKAKTCLSNISLIIIIYTYKVMGQTYPREIGYYSFSDKMSNSFRFDLTHLFNLISDTDWNFIQYLKKRIIGLPFRPHPNEKAISVNNLEYIIEDLYQRESNEEKSLVGIYQSDYQILNKLKLPYIDLSYLGKLSYSDDMKTCDYHIKKPFIQCAEKKCIAVSNLVYELSL